MKDYQQGGNFEGLGQALFLCSSLINATFQVLAKTPCCNEILMMLVISLMIEGRMSLSKVVGIGLISQLFDTIPFITMATSDSALV